MRWVGPLYRRAVLACTVCIAYDGDTYSVAMPTIIQRTLHGPCYRLCVRIVLRAEMCEVWRSHRIKTTWACENYDEGSDSDASERDGVDGSSIVCDLEICTVVGKIESDLTGRCRQDLSLARSKFRIRGFFHRRAFLTSGSCSSALLRCACHRATDLRCHYLLHCCLLRDLVLRSELVKKLLPPGICKSLQ